MPELLWDALMAELAAEVQPSHAQRLCVECWYAQSSAPFPAHLSSSLCAPHAAAIRARTRLLPVPVQPSVGVCEYVKVRTL